LLLEAVPGGGILVAGGDNDTFPLWYLQQVEDLRPDVTIVTVPLLGAEWYRASLARSGVLPRARVSPWGGVNATLASVMAQASRQRRSLRVSALLPAADRKRLDPTIGWALQGMVYAPDSAGEAGATVLDGRAMRTSREQVPPGALRALPPFADPAARTAQELLRCATVQSLTDTLLVSGCSGI
jgi:hypothetical protein